MINEKQIIDIIKVDNNFYFSVMLISFIIYGQYIYYKINYKTHI